jgi:YbbR domain-containing protein
MEVSMKKFDLKKILYNDRRLKLISIIMAFLFWFIIVSYISPDYTVTINNVQISTENSDLTLSSFDLHVIKLSQKEVSLDISGPRYLLGKLSSKDFIVRPKYTQVAKSGNFDVELIADFKSPDSRLKIKKINTPTVNIYFDKKITKTIPVEADVQSTKIADGYIMQSAVINPKTIDVTGPEIEMAAVTKALVTVKVSDNASDVLNTSSNVTVYSSNKKPTDMAHMTLKISKVNVTIPILLTREIPFVLGFKNLPAGFDSSNISYTVTPAKVRIAGTTEVVNGISQINLGDVDFLSLDITNTLKYNMQLPAGISDIENVSTASVDVTLKNTTEKTFSTKKISAINVPNNLHVIIKTKTINNIQLYGPSAQIAALANIEAVTDMSKVTNGVGQYEVPVTIIVPNQTGYWTKVQYKALIYVY